MAVKLPLVLSSAGEVQRLQSGDSITTGAFNLNALSAAADYTITANYGLLITDQFEIANSVNFEIANTAILMIA